MAVQDDNIDAAKTQEHFKFLFGQIYPLDWITLSLYPDDASATSAQLCWRFHKPDPGVFERIADVVRSFQGCLPCRFTLERDFACIDIGATPIAYPPLGDISPEVAALALSSRREPAPDSTDKVARDLQALSGHLASALSLQAPEPISGGAGDSIQQRDPLTSNVQPGAPFEPHMQYTWLMSDTSQFFATAQPTSAKDRSLDLRLSYKEWHAIFVGALGVVGPEGVIIADQNLADAKSYGIFGFHGDIPGRPMLSRYNDCFDDVVYEAAEVPSLRQECVKLREETSLQVARQGLAKLIRICDEAEKLALSIYFMSD